MIGQVSRDINLTVFETDRPELEAGKDLECITFGERELFIILRLGDIEQNLKIESLPKNKGYMIIIGRKTWQDYVAEEIELIGTMGIMEGYPAEFDRLHIIYEDINGTNATKILNPLATNPELRDSFI